MFIFGRETELKAGLGFWQLFLMTVAGTLGAGFFVLLGKGAAMAGPFLPFSFLIAGGMGFLISQVYSELAASMPAPGGGQVYIRTAFGHHPFLFLIHWLTWLAEIAFTALNALGLGFYLSLVISLDPLLISLLVIVLFTVINLFGVEKVGRVGIWLGIGLLLAVSGILTLFLRDFSWPDIWIRREFFSFTYLWGWIRAVPLVFIVFVGNEDVAAIAAEVKNKEKNIPRVLSLSVLTLTIFTVFFSFLFLQSFPLEQLANNPHPFSLLGEKLGGWGEILSLATAIFACSSSLFLGSLADTRTAFALSKAGEFPSLFSRLNRYKAPFISILSSTLLVIFLCLTNNASHIAYVANIGFFLECIVVSLALINLRKKRPHLPRPFLLSPFPLVPILVVVLSCFFLVFIEPRAWLMAVFFSSVGFLVYLFSHVKKDRIEWILKGFLAFLMIFILVFFGLCVWRL